MPAEMWFQQVVPKVCITFSAAASGIFPAKTDAPVISRALGSVSTAVIFLPSAIECAILRVAGVQTARNEIARRHYGRAVLYA